MTDQQLLDDLLELGTRRMALTVRVHRRPLLRQISMTDDALMVLANGAVMDRGAVTAALGQAPPWRSFELSDARGCRAPERTTAALVYIGTAERDGADEPFVGAMSSVYRRTA